MASNANTMADAIPGEMSRFEKMDSKHFSATNATIANTPKTTQGKLAARPGETPMLFARRKKASVAKKAMTARMNIGS